MSITMKKCSRCGTEKPITEFYNSQNLSDGKTIWCKDCVKEYNRNRYNRIKMENINMNPTQSPKSDIRGGQNNDLSRFTPRELMQELAKRGYRGTLEYVKRIDITKF